jgi:hypothetical protein
MHDIYINNADLAQHYRVIYCFSRLIEKTHDICMVLYNNWQIHNVCMTCIVIMPIRHDIMV